jgi:hypothetical protein
MRGAGVAGNVKYSRYKTYNPDKDYQSPVPEHQPRSIALEGESAKRCKPMHVHETDWA